MNRKEFSLLMQEVASWRNFSRLLQGHADHLENRVLNLAGVKHVNREPGFPCWTIVGVSGYHNTPDDAIAAKESQLVGHSQLLTEQP